MAKTRWRKAGKRIRIGGKRQYATRCCCGLNCGDCRGKVAHKTLLLTITGFADSTVVKQCTCSDGLGHTSKLGTFTRHCNCSFLNGTYSINGATRCISFGAGCNGISLAIDDACVHTRPPCADSHTITAIWYLNSICISLGCDGDNVTWNVITTGTFCKYEDGVLAAGTDDNICQNWGAGGSINFADFCGGLPSCDTFTWVDCAGAPHAITICLRIL